LKKYIFRINLINLFRFDLENFDKDFITDLDSSDEFITKYPMDKISNILEKIPGESIKIPKSGILDT
jgi:hypothetical protein